MARPPEVRLAWQVDGKRATSRFERWSVRKRYYSISVARRAYAERVFLSFGDFTTAGGFLSLAARAVEFEAWASWRWLSRRLLARCWRNSPSFTGSFYYVQVRP